MGKRPRTFTAGEERAILSAYASGSTVAQLRQVYETGWTQVARVLRAHGVYEGRRRTQRVDRDVEIARRYVAGETMSDIATSVGVSRSRVSMILARDGIEHRAPGPPQPDYVPRIRTLREQGYGSRRIDKELDIGITTATKWIHRFGMSSGRGHPAGPEHPAWRGGVILIEGYRSVKVPKDDPMYVMAWRTGYVPEHRLVMARSLGRSLTRSETVHHINGDKTDNRLENLQLRQGRHGKGARFTCLDCGSHNVGAVNI